jgi:hypothetical protein
MDSEVDFVDHRDMVMAGARPGATTRLSVKGIKVAGTDIAAIAPGAVMELIIHVVPRLSPSQTEVKQLA